MASCDSKTIGPCVSRLRKIQQILLITKTGACPFCMQALLFTYDGNAGATDGRENKMKENMQHEFALLLYQFARLSTKQLLSLFHFKTRVGFGAESLKSLKKYWNNEFTSLFTFFNKKIFYVWFGQEQYHAP